MFYKGLGNCWKRCLAFVANFSIIFDPRNMNIHIPKINCASSIDSESPLIDLLSHFSLCSRIPGGSCIVVFQLIQCTRYQIWYVPTSSMHLINPQCSKIIFDMVFFGFRRGQKNVGPNGPKDSTGPKERHGPKGRHGRKGLHGLKVPTRAITLLSVQE